MKIDGWDIALANARQARYTDGHHALSNDSAWTEGSNRPIFQRNRYGFKKFTLELWVKGDGYQEIVDNRGVILSHLIGEVVLEPDWTTHKFRAVLNKYNVTESSKQRFHVLKLEFNGYEYEDVKEYETEANTEFVIENVGTMETPVTLELTPIGGAVDIPDEQTEAYLICDEDGGYLVDDDGTVIAGYDHSTLIIDGLCRDPRTGESLLIEVRNYKLEQKIVIDGETGIITENGEIKIEDVDVWSLPTLQPGENLIRTNNNWLRVVVRYKPHFM